jgi:hypothetical protein
MGIITPREDGFELNRLFEQTAKNFSEEEKINIPVGAVNLIDSYPATSLHFYGA